MLDTLELRDTGIKPNISFFRKDELICPSCEKDIPQEDIRTGSGRLDAGELRNDLHRLYISTKEHGSVYPIIYGIYTCNNCYYSLLKYDMGKLSQKSIENISTQDAVAERKESLKHLFKDIPDFSTNKTLVSAVAAYLLTVQTYNQCNVSDVPTIRMAICALRAAWLCGHIKDFCDDEFVDSLTSILYKKSLFLYNKAMDLALSGDEDLLSTTLGPDIDKDYRYDGVVYIQAWLLFHYGISPNRDKRIRVVAKI